MFADEKSRQIFDSRHKYYETGDMEYIHPTLAISIYHKPEDIVELPDFIKSLDSNYNLYLRNYHMDHTETVLYAFYPQ